eukprot:Selendium_serpulae@DN5425_c0_g1_i4.p1
MVHSTKLYDILGVAPTANKHQILKAYRLRALQLHPDKNRDDPKATECFQQLQMAFEILKDETRRHVYDTSGCTEEETPIFQTSFDYYRELFPPVTASDIESFKSRYKGSSEERDDLIHFYQENDGDISTLFECIILAEPEEAQRFTDLYHQYFNEKALDRTKKFDRSAAKLPKMAERFARKREAEAKESEQENGDFNSLIAAIQENQTKRSGGFLEALEQKHCRPVKVAKPKKKGLKQSRPKAGQKKDKK